jgi:hypothetical protein
LKWAAELAEVEEVAEVAELAELAEVEEVAEVAAADGAGRQDGRTLNPLTKHCNFRNQFCVVNIMVTTA